MRIYYFYREGLTPWLPSWHVIEAILLSLTLLF